jgi:hypothetical protein
MKKLIFLVLMAFLVAQVGFAQKAQVVKEVKAAKVEKSRGANPNIKMGAPTVDKAKEKQRGDCAIKFDNWTGFVVDVYVDGDYQGTVGAWGSGWVTVGEGYTTIYCITRGGTYEWSAAGNCEGDYLFKLSI